MADHPSPDTTLPDDTRHGAVPPMGPAPHGDDPGRAPVPNPKKPGDNPKFPPERKPFPGPDTGTPKGPYPANP